MSTRNEANAIEQVAETKCGRCHGTQLIPSSHPQGKEPCPSCEASGFRWPSLSRDCDCIAWYAGWGGRNGEPHPECNYCNTSGHVPDVTLEKVLPLIFCIRRNDYDGRWIAYNGTTNNEISYYGNTPLEAACSALLATVETL